MFVWLHAGAAHAVVCVHHAYGGAGAAKLGEAVVAACKQPVDFNFLYDLKQPIKVHTPACCVTHCTDAAVYMLLVGCVLLITIIA